MNAKLPTDPPTDEKPSRAQVMYQSWAARKLAEAPKHPDNLYKWQGWLEDWYQHHDGIAVTLMRRDLADHALEEMEALVSTVGEMLAEGREAEIVAMARRVAEEFMEFHKEALLGIRK